MPFLISLITTLHAAAALAWLGMTFFSGWKAGPEAGKLFWPRTIAAFVTLGAGGQLWMWLHWGGTTRIEMLLGAGAVLGVLALLGQLALGIWRKTVNKVAFVMLAVGFVLMIAGTEMKRF